MTDIKLTGWLLLAGGITFAIGAALWRISYQAELGESLRLIAGDRFRWRWIHGWMILGTVLTTLGMIGLGRLMNDTPSALTSAVSVGCFQLGAVLWIIALVFRLTVFEWAAAETVRTGIVPSGIDSWHRWAGGLYAVHMILSYLSNALLGWCFLETGLVSAWLGKTALWGGGLFAIGFIVTSGGPFAPPFWAHVITFMAGVALLNR